MCMVFLDCFSHHLVVWQLVNYLLKSFLWGLGSFWNISKCLHEVFHRCLLFSQRCFHYSLMVLFLLQSKTRLQLQAGILSASTATWNLPGIAEWCCKWVFILNMKVLVSSTLKRLCLRHWLKFEAASTGTARPVVLGWAYAWVCSEKLTQGFTERWQEALMRGGCHTRVADVDYGHYQQYLWHYWSPKLVRIKIYLPPCFLFVSQGLFTWLLQYEWWGGLQFLLSVSINLNRSLSLLSQQRLEPPRASPNLANGAKVCVGCVPSLHAAAFPCPPSCWVQTFRVCCLLWSGGFLACSVLQVAVWTRGRDFESSDKGASVFSIEVQNRHAVTRTLRVGCVVRETFTNADSRYCAE